ncbi:MAG TPA: type I restriction enzyme HsdR N-terminal domain-containing protein, partial [Methylocella sp.]|nr:type I restriction enzyme HsdR N-terminal domain-containing protein [Methylocella sp.]
MTEFWDKLPLKGLTSEADVELRLIEPLLRALGYEDYDIATKYPVEFQQGRKGRKPAADFVCFAGPLKNRDTSLLVVEAKAPGQALPPGKAQGESYAMNLRAPVLVLTNGETFEIWQWQAAQESVCVLDIHVDSFLAERGRIEQLLSKSALMAYCRSLEFKTILEASADYGSYETAELMRTASHSAWIERTLKYADANSSEIRIEASQLTETFPGGAIIVAASGYGKTTLAGRLFREAIEARQRKSRTSLPFDILLPELVLLSVDILEFLYARLSAHCPGVSLAVLKQILRDTGPTLLCDGFDRVAAEARMALNAKLSAFIRDYPKAQVFVFSRRASKPHLNLPVLELEALTDGQMRAMESAILDEEDT